MPQFDEAGVRVPCNKLTGSLARRSYLFACALARRPRDVWRWISDRLHPCSTIELRLPWISWAAIDFLKKNLSNGCSVFEWGSGGSTLFFLDAGCFVTTAENNEEWAQRVKSAAGSGALEMKFIGLPLQITTYGEKEKEYVTSARGKTYDVLLVDGVGGDVPMRMMCLQEARELVKPGGLVILDDSWRPEYAEAPKIMSGFERRVFRSTGPARRGCTQTDVYVAPR